MNDFDWAGLDTTPVREVRRRALIMQRLSETEPTELPGADLIGWQSFAGDHVNWLFLPDGRVLLLPFDHESDLNFIPDWEVDDQLRMFEGVPADLLTLVRDREDEAEFAMVETVPASSGVFFFDGESWQVAPGLRALVAERNLDLSRDTGYSFCLSWYSFGSELTPESLAADGAEERWGFSLDQLREIFVEVDVVL